MRGIVRFVIPVLALCTLLVNLSSAQGSFYCVTNPSGYSGALTSDFVYCINGTLPYVFIGLLLTFTMVAFAYLIGEVLNISSFKGWYRAELWEAVKSLAIVAIIFSSIILLGAVATAVPSSAIPSSCTVSGAPTVSQNIDNMYCYASAYISQMQGSAEEAYYATLGIAIGAEATKDIQLQTYLDIPLPPVPVTDVAFGSVNLGTNQNLYQSSILETDPTKPTNFLKDSMNLLIVPMLLAFGTQGVLFYTFVALGFGLLLPLGLIFRAVPLLRGIGGTLIALAIVSTMIYPALLALFNAPMTSFFSPFYGAASGATSYGCGSACVATGIINPAIDGLVASLSSGNDQTAALEGNSAAASAFWNSDFSQVLNVMFQYDIPVAIQFVLLVVDLIIGVTAATNLAKALGGNIRLGIGNLKLV